MPPISPPPQWADPPHLALSLHQDQPPSPAAAASAAAAAASLPQDAIPISFNPKIVSPTTEAPQIPTSTATQRVEEAPAGSPTQKQQQQQQQGRTGSKSRRRSHRRQRRRRRTASAAS